MSAGAWAQEMPALLLRTLSPGTHDARTIPRPLTAWAQKTPANLLMTLSASGRYDRTLLGIPGGRARGYLGYREFGGIFQTSGKCCSLRFR